jgi:choice-of-anchor B domain-containing protein
MRTNRTWLAALLLAVIFPAAADEGKPRYVAASGADTGDCRNRFRPCHTLGYAIAQAGKGDLVQVAEGQYTVSDSKQLYELLAMAGRIQGGFRKISGYSDRGATGETVLVGVPPEFRERFEAEGFTVIVDTKGLEISRDESQRMRAVSQKFSAAEQSHALTPCVSGTSAGFACQSMGMLAHMSLQNLTPGSARGNDVWGFLDLNTGREYAFMGLQNGVAVVDVTNPEAPEQVASASGSPTTWRDIKVYQHFDLAASRWRAYAYVTADAVPDVLMVLDLSALPNGIEVVNFSSDIRGAHNAYLLNADYTYGLAQTTSAPLLGVAGANLNGGNHRLYALDNPRSPTIQRISGAGYSHDLASFPVTDARKNSQCGASGRSQPVCQVLSDFNENTVDVWDVTAPASPLLLSSQPYANASYVHSGWWSEDGRHLFVHDELDEQNRGLNTTVRVFDMANLTAPALAGSWVGPTRAIDHNGFAKGNRYYISNYSEGLTVLDLSSPASPVRIGYFDTFPASSETGFVGAWGVYPFFASGTIAVGDINSGLYLLRNETLTTPSGSFTMSSAAITGTEGQGLVLSVNRGSGATGAVSVQLEVLNASTTAADAALLSTTLNWAAGDTAAKTATLNLASDALNEGLELVLIRLKNPQGGATIGYPDTTAVHIGDVGAATRLRALEAAPTIDEARAKAMIAVRRLSSAGGEARLGYRTVAGGTYGGVTAAQGELVWADGDTAAKLVTLQLNPATLAAGGSGTFQVELLNPVNATLEDATGAAVTTQLLTLTVRDGAVPPVTPNPPNNPPSSGGGGGGGGSVSIEWLLLLTLLLAMKLACGRQARCSTSH